MTVRHSHKPSSPIFMDEEAINEALSKMEQDPILKTTPILVKGSSGSVMLVTFREKHASYLKQHPKVNPEHYLANLHAMIKIRP